MVSLRRTEIKKIEINVGKSFSMIKKRRKHGNVAFIRFIQLKYGNNVIESERIRRLPYLILFPYVSEKKRSCAILLIYETSSITSTNQGAR